MGLQGELIAHVTQLLEYANQGALEARTLASAFSLVYLCMHCLVASFLALSSSNNAAFIGLIGHLRDSIK